MLDAINVVEKYLGPKDFEDFKRDQLVQDGVIRRITIIGEAAKHISEATRQKHPKIPWQDVAGMRDKLVNAYFGIDLSEVWLTAKNDLPKLKKELEKIRT
jgi:uncharacterized protein with HEPN domain